MSMAIAETILRQMGGTGRLSVMVGAYQFVALEDGVKFRFKGSKKANLVMVKLTARDTYDVEFFKMAKFDYKQIAVVEDVYADQLRRVFEQMTGLYLSL